MAFINNRLLNRDNLAIRRKLDDTTYLFCAENESINHLFLIVVWLRGLSITFLT